MFSVIRQHRCEWRCLPHQPHDVEAYDVDACDYEAHDYEAYDVQAHDFKAHDVEAHDVFDRMHLSQWYAWYQMCWIEGL